MIQINGKGLHASENIIDNLLSFNVNSTWPSVGTGNASVVSSTYFDGSGSLLINNTDYQNTDLTVSNSTQNTLIPYDGDYDFSLYLKKSLSEDVIINVEIFKNASSVYNQDLTFASFNTDNWTSFMTNENFRMLKNDVVTFIFTVKSNASSVSNNLVIYMDGLHFYNKERNQTKSPIYSKPVDDVLNSLKGEKGFGFYIDSLATPTITIGTSWTEITIDALGANVIDNLPLDIRGVSNLLTSGKITPIASGDDYDGRLDVTIDSKTGSPTYLEVIIDFAGSTPDTLRAFTGYIQTAKTPPFKQSLGLDFFTGDTFLSNGGKIYARTDTGSWTISNRNIKITRKSKRFI